MDVAACGLKYPRSGPQNAVRAFLYFKPDAYLWSYPMLKKNAVLVGAIAGALMATPVLAAAGDNCLQHNRVVSWKALDEHTLVFTDRFMRQYTAEMKEACEGITRGDAKIVYETWENLQCLEPGLIIHVVAPGIRGTCAIGSVHAGSPAAPHR
jgi:hypothetical protein